MADVLFFREPDMQPAHEIHEELQFRLSLLRLMTEPHRAVASVPPGREPKQLEELVVLTSNGRKAMPARRKAL